MQQIDIWYRTKIDDSMDFLKKYEPPEGYFLAFSGGKDSIVLYDLAVKSGVKFTAYYTYTTIDPPELVKFIRKHYPDVTWLRPEKHFFKFMLEKGFPTRLRRWCCDHIKKKPSENIPLTKRILGIRQEESWKRKSRGEINQYKKEILHNPIFYWLEWEVWEYIKDNNIPYCELYDLGFDRIGCVVCPFIFNGSPKLEMHKKQWEGYYKTFELYLKKYWNKKKGFDGIFGTFDEFLYNYYHGNNLRIIKDIKIEEENGGNQ